MASMKILVIKMSAIGDVIHALPAVNALRRSLPDAHIAWLVEEAASEIVTSHRAVDRVLVSKRQGWVRGLLSRSCLESVNGIRVFVESLRDTTYDLVIDFQGLLKSAAMVGLSRGDKKLGYNRTREFSYVVLNHRVPPFDVDKHAIFRYLNLIRHLGIEIGDIRFDIPFGDDERSRVRAMLSGKGWEGRDVVCVNPVAKWDTKLWSRRKFSGLADRISEELGCLVVLSGSRADRKEVEGIVSRMRRDSCVNLAGLTDLKHLAALYEMSKCVVSTDTGPMHLSAAVGTPVVALFGPTAPWRTGPFGEGHEIVRAELSCSPCFKKKCESVACMKLISVEQVFDSVSEIMSRGAHA